MDTLTTAGQGPAEPEAAAPPDGPESYSGILYPGPAPAELADDPDYFRDLRLDDLVAAVTSGRERYALAPFLRARCPDTACVEYRQAVFRDLEGGGTAAAVRAFAEGMGEVRRCLDRLGRGHYTQERRWWMLQAGLAYVRTVVGLRDALAGLPVRSSALLGARRLLDAYTASPGFRDIARDAAAAADAPAAVRYQLRIAGPRITVRRAEPGAPDYGAEVLNTFRRFAQGDGREYRFKFTESPQLNHVEAAVADRVALLFPREFGLLAAFADRHAGFADPRVERLDREVQFYLGVMEHLERVRRAGGEFCYPEVADSGVELRAVGAFDLALAARLAAAGRHVVVNDIALRAPERVVVVTGPNQGGKTTFSRMVGQLLHLAALGIPVPGREASLPLADGIHTLFEREEAVEDLVSKLEDDLRRTRAILARITDRSLVIMNETFSSTTVADQAFINRRVLEAIGAVGAWCVTVTFLDELATLTPETVSMVSAVDPADPTRRTFRVVRRRADGLAYAAAIADKHRLTREQIALRARR